MDKIELYTSKSKSLALLFGSLVFVIVGIWMILDTDKTGDDLENYFYGSLCVLFFSFGIFIGLKRIIRPQLMLIIDSKGININPKVSIRDFIEWKEISDFGELRIKTQKFIVINLYDPEVWIEKEVKPAKRKLMKMNLKNYGSPFQISVSGLNINYPELKDILNTYYQQSKI